MSVEDILRGMANVERHNDMERRKFGWYTVHEPSIGPYTEENPNVCMKCGRLLVRANISKPCPSRLRQWIRKAWLRALRRI